MSRMGMPISGNCRRVVRVSLTILWGFLMFSEGIKKDHGHELGLSKLAMIFGIVAKFLARQHVTWNIATDAHFCNFVSINPSLVNVSNLYLLSGGIKAPAEKIVLESNSLNDEQKSLGVQWQDYASFFF